MTKNNIKSSFILGDEWIFYKFYCGFKSSDKVLVHAIKPVVEQLLSNGVIDKFFFIRYSDPDLHLRVRFHYSNKDNIGIIINSLNSHISKYVSSSTISNVIIDRYDREIKRYGENTMELSESIFSHDSIMIVNLLHFLSDKGDFSEQIRWKFGLKGIDQLLSDFKLDIDDKFDVITRLRDGFNTEFNIEKYSKKKLNDSYRERRKEIEIILNNDSSFEYVQLFNDLLGYRSKANAPIVSNILELKKNNLFQLELEQYLGSLSHMFLNRLFRSNQRAQEMVLYNYLWKYYDSVIARSKYKNKNKKKVDIAATA